MDYGSVILLIIGWLVALSLIVSFAILVFMGAAGLLGWASEQGFVGVGAYVACWVFLFPFMLAACFIAGIFVYRRM